MNAYGFDKTIYKRDSSTDFFKYMLLTRPYLLVFLPWFLIIFALYGCKVISKWNMMGATLIVYQKGNNCENN